MIENKICHACHGSIARSDNTCHHCGAKAKVEISEKYILSIFIISAFIFLIIIF